MLSSKLISFVLFVGFILIKYSQCCHMLRSSSHQLILSSHLPYKLNPMRFKPRSHSWNANILPTWSHAHNLHLSKLLWFPNILFKLVFIITQSMTDTFSKLRREINDTGFLSQDKIKNISVK